MDRGEPTSVGDIIPKVLGPLVVQNREDELGDETVVTNFNDEAHAFLEKSLDSRDYADWVLYPGVFFAKGHESSTGEKMARIIVPNTLIQGWLENPQHQHRNLITQFFAGKQIDDWNFVIDKNYCKRIEEGLPPRQPMLPNMPESDGEWGKKKKPQKKPFSPGKPPLPETLPLPDDIVTGKKGLLFDAYMACRELTKRNMEEPRIISAVLHGPPGTSKETLLLMTVRMAQERLKNPKIFCLSGAEFQALYVSCFLPENRIDGDRLNIFKKCLFEADLLAISDIDGTTSKAVGTKKLLAEAIKAVLNRGGRVLVSLSVELSVESLGEDLFRVISGFTRFRTEKVGIEHYKKIAWQYLRRNPPQIKTSLPRGNKGQIPSLDPKVVSWVVSRAQIAGNLSFLLSCLDRISFSQGIEGGEKKVTLPKAQEILGLRPTIPDINAFVLEKYRQGDTCEAETLPEEALGIVAYFAIEISGINRSEVARSIYPGPCRGEEKTEARVNEIEQKLKEPGEARDLFCDLVKDFLRRFSVPESKNLFWSHRLQEWV